MNQESRDLRAGFERENKASSQVIFRILQFLIRYGLFDNPADFVQQVVNLAPDLSGSGRELPYDGFAEAWFESLEAMRASANSPEIKVVLDDEPNLFDISTRFSVIVEEHVIVG